MTSFLRKTALITWFLTIELTSACNNGWFGPLCQYKCHCTNKLCTADGECRKGAQCERAWFGPACQYVVMPSFHVSFKDSKQESINCTNQRNNRVDAVTVDISCELNATVQEVHIAGANGSAIDVCSLFVSGGQNLALKQNATQTSVWKEFGISHAAQLAVDGNRENLLEKGSCAHTEPSKGSPRWQVTLARPSLVNRYALYNRRRDPGKQSLNPSTRLKGFILKSFSQNGSQVFDYKDPSSEAKYVYTVVSASAALVSKVEITGVVNNGEHILELCEVEIFGESTCEDGWYGLNCSSKYLSEIFSAPPSGPVDNTTEHQVDSVPVVYMHILGGTSGILLLVVLILVLITIKTCKKSALGLEAGKVHHVMDYCSYKSENTDNHEYHKSTENIDLFKDEHSIYSNPTDNTFGDHKRLVDVPNQPANKCNNISKRLAPYTTFPCKQSSLDAVDRNLSPTSSGFKTVKALPDEEVDDQNVYEN